MKKVLFLMLSILSTFSYGSDYNCLGSGNFDHLETSIDISRSFWSGKIKSIKYTDNVDRTFKFRFEYMSLGEMDLSQETLVNDFGLASEEAKFIKAQDYYYYKKGQDEFYFEKGLLENSNSGWMIVIDRPWCFWDACSDKYKAYLCQ